MLIGVNSVVKSTSLKEFYLTDIKKLFDGRMIRDEYLYKSSPALVQMYEFCKKVIDILQI